MADSTSRSNVTLFTLQEHFRTTTAFLAAAKSVIGPVLHQVDGFRDAELDEDGTPKAPTITDYMGRMSQDEITGMMGDIAAGATNVGYALEHSLRLAVFLDSGSYPPPNRRHKFTPVYELLSPETKGVLQEIRTRLGPRLADYHIQEQSGRAKREPKDRPAPPSGDAMKDYLAEIDRYDFLFGGRYRYSQPSVSTWIMLPFSLIRLIDLFLSEHLGPGVGVSYRPLTFGKVADDGALPTLTWDGTTLEVRLPDSTTGTSIRAKWKPAVSILRFRRIGESEWGPGIITPLQCHEFNTEGLSGRFEVMVSSRDANGVETQLMTQTIGQKDQKE